MATQSTNAGRDHLDVVNRLDRVVLAVRADGAELQTTLTPEEARAVAQLLRDAADTGEHTPGS